MMRRLVAALLVAVLPWLGSAPAPAQELVRPVGPPIALDVGKGVLIRLERDADTVFVANPNIADVQVKSPRLLYLYGKDPGETSLYAVDAQQQVMLSRPVIVKHDVASLQSALAKLVPQGTVSVEAVDKSLVLSGSVASPVEAEEVRHLARSFADEKQLVNRVTVDAPNQVNLRVRVAEVSRTVTKELGINWETVLHPGNFVFGVATGNPVLGVTQPGGTTLIPLAPGIVQKSIPTSPSIPGFFTRNSGLGGTATNSIMLGLNAGGTMIDSVIDALEQNGLVTILAEPSLTALSGETASFLAGGEFPIVMPGSLGQVSIDFKQYGVSLAFTPVVLAGGRISLRVRPEVSELATQGAVQINGINIPALATRRAETTVELGSGQSFAIGGLLQNSVTDTLNKLPGLGELPVLGPLFRSTQFQRNESELVILVTPYLVRPVSDRRLAAPTDGYAPASDADRILGGRNARVSEPVGGKAPVGPGGNGLIGPAGFILN